MMGGGQVNTSEYSVLEVTLNILLRSLFAWWGYTVAKRKGFQPQGSAIASFFFLFIAIIVLYARKPKINNNKSEGI